MPTYKPNVRTSKSAKGNIQNKNRKKILAVVALLIAVAGGVLIYRSFASTQEIGTSDPFIPGPMWLQTQQIEANSKVVRTMSNTNNWLTPDQSRSLQNGQPTVGTLSGVNALAEAKNARYWLGKENAGVAKATKKEFKQILICARVLKGEGTAIINAQTAQGTKTIARVNIQNKDRIYCGSADPKTITEVSYIYEPKQGKTMTIRDVSLRPVIVP